MNTAFSSLLLPATLDRLVLLVNHVLQAEPQAVRRLTPHAGRRVALHWEAEPGPWPLPPPLQLRITPAGLLEACEPAVAGDGAPPADLRVRIELPAPHRLVAQWLSGRRPTVSVDGDAQLAADVAWLGENLRWDIAQDLSKLIGPGPAHELARLASAAAGALRQLAQGAASAWSARPGAPPAAPR